MKKIIERNSLSSSRLMNESFDDFAEGLKELHNAEELGRMAFQNAANDHTPVLIWEFAGNGAANDLGDFCEENICADGEYNYIQTSMRSVRGNVRGFLNGIDAYDIVIIDDFTFGSINDIRAIMNYIMSNLDDKLFICVAKYDAANNEDVYEAFADRFMCAVYSPQLDRQSYFGREDEDDDIVESVSTKFGKYRKLYESEDGEDDGIDYGDGGDEGAESGEEEKPEGEEGNEGEGNIDGESGEEETEDVPMTAILLTVKKDDVDKCKEELVDAGIPEDAIDEIEGEDDDENAKIKVDADYALELKDYLAGKGIDLEEKIGGEIVDDSKEADKEEDGEEENKEGEGEEGDGEFSEEDFDKELGDLFAEE